MARHHDRDAVVARRRWRPRARLAARPARRQVRRNCGSGPREFSSAHPRRASGTRCRAGRPARRACLPASALGHRAHARREEFVAAGVDALELAPAGIPHAGALPAPAHRRPVPPCRCRVRWSRPARWPSAVSTSAPADSHRPRRPRGSARASCRASPRRLRTRARASRSRRRTARR